MQRLIVSWALVLSLSPFLGCREGGSPGSLSDASFEELTAKLPDEVRANLRDPDPILRFDALTELDSLSAAERIALLRYLWEIETEPELKSDMVDVASDTPGVEGTRFLEWVAKGPARLIDRDDALYYLTTEGFIEHLDLGVIREILYQSDLHEDLFTGLLLVLEKKGDGPSRALLRETLVENPNDSLRRYAAFSLARIDDQESLPLLRERMEAETSSWTRQAIEHAIRDLEKSEGATQS